LVLTDMLFSEAKYVRNFDDYLKMRNGL